MFTLYDGYNIQLRNPCTHKVGDSIIKVKSCSALLCVLLVCVYSQLSKICSEISFWFWKPVIQTLCLCQQGCENLWLFFKVKWCLSAKKFGRNCIREYDMKMTCSLWCTELYFIYDKRGGILLQIFSCIDSIHRNAGVTAEHAA